MFSSLRLATVAIVVLIACVQAFDHNCELKDFIKVSGAGKATYKNSISAVQLGVMSMGKSAMDVQKKLASMSTKLVYYLNKNQATRLQKSSVSLTSLQHHKHQRKQQGRRKNKNGRGKSVFRGNGRRGGAGKKHLRRGMRHGWKGRKRGWRGKRGKNYSGKSKKHHGMGMHNGWHDRNYGGKGKMSARKRFEAKGKTGRRGSKKPPVRNKGTYYVEKGPGGSQGTYFVRKGAYTFSQSRRQLLVDRTKSHQSVESNTGTSSMSRFARTNASPLLRNRKRKPLKAVQHLSRRYVGHMTISFEVPIETSSKVVRGAATYGAKTVVSMHFKASKKDAAAGRAAAIADAVKTARAEAEGVAEVSQQKIIAPKTITITNVFMPGAKPAPWGGRRMSSASAPLIEIVGSAQRVDAFISIGYVTGDLYEL